MSRRGGGREAFGAGTRPVHASHGGPVAEASDPVDLLSGQENQSCHRLQVSTGATPRPNPAQRGPPRAGLPLRPGAVSRGGRPGIITRLVMLQGRRQQTQKRAGLKTTSYAQGGRACGETLNHHPFVTCDL